MIKTVLIDDERPALRELEYFLQTYPDISIIETFTNPLKAIEKISCLQPDLVFLDINMPQLLGIDAASEILDSCEKVDIVFVTAYDKYAINAFEIHALDYLLKPLNEDRFAITIQRVLRNIDTKEKPTAITLSIQCLGKFQLNWADEDPIKWRTEKNKELFAYLLHHRNRDVSKEELLDNLWPEDDPVKAIRQLYNGIYYIRKALGDYGIGRNLINIDSNYNLKLGDVQSDVNSFYKFEKSSSNQNIRELENLASLYIGDYLESDYYSWADIERERLTRIYLQCLVKLSQKLVEAQRWDKAEKYLLEAYRKDPYAEYITELLLISYIETGNKAKALKHYQNFSNLISEELGLESPKKLQELVRTIS